MFLPLNLLKSYIKAKLRDISIFAFWGFTIMIHIQPSLKDTFFRKESKKFLAENSCVNKINKTTRYFK